MEDKEVYCFKVGGVTADTRESTRRHCHACHCNGYQIRRNLELFADTEEDEDGLEENELVLEHY